MGQAGGRPPAARRGGARPLRGGRPLLPLALRAPLQLRADVGPPRRLDLLGPLRRGHPLRRDGLRPREARPRGRRHRLLRRRPQGDGPLRDVGAARRARPRRRARRCCPADAARAPAPRGPARLPPQPDRPRRRSSASFGAKALDGHPTPATPFVRLSTGASGVGVASSIGLALAARDYYGDDGPARPRRRGRGRPHPGPRGRGARRGRHRLARQRRLSTSTGTRPRSTRTASAARTASRATTCSGRRWSSSTCTTGTWSRCRTAATSSR